MKKSQTKVTVSVASPQAQPVPASQPEVMDEQAEQLTQEIQEYVNNLAMDDLQAKLSRHEGRSVAPGPGSAEPPAMEPEATAAARPVPVAEWPELAGKKVDPTLADGNPAAQAPATSDRQASIPAARPAPALPPPTVHTQADLAPASPAPAISPAVGPITGPATTGRHVALEPELIVPGEADSPAMKQPSVSAPSAVVTSYSAAKKPALTPADLSPTRQPSNPSPTPPTGTASSVLPAPIAPPAADPQVVAIDISPAVLATLTTQPSPQAVQPRTNQPAAVKAGPSDDLKHLIDQLRKEAGDRPDSVGAALRLRLAEWSLTGTVSPEEWPLQDDDKRRLAQSVWQVLQVVSKMEASPQGAPGGEFQKAIESLTETLQQVQPLQIPVAQLCRSVSSFGCPDPMPEPWQFPAGRTNMVVLYCELAGFKSEPAPAKANWYHTLLSLRLAVLTPSGKEVFSYEDQQVEDFCRRPRRDFFITKLLKIGSELPAGNYVLKVTIRDKLANRVTETNVPFEITNGLRDAGSRVVGESGVGSRVVGESGVGSRDTDRR